MAGERGPFLKRREFLATALAGAGGAILGGSLLAGDAPAASPVAAPAAPPATGPFRIVPLGKTGVKVSLVGAGTGMSGGNRQSNQTRLGAEKFEALLKYAYERGIRFFDCADLYGTHPFVARALKGIPREKYAISTKIWVHAGGIPDKERPDADVVIDRFRKELDTDYIDLVLIHCMSNADWCDRQKRQMEIMAGLKQKGIIRAHGVSVHSLAALKACAVSPWVDSVHVRVNAYGDAMDDRDPAVVAAVLKQLRDAGKGVVGMKLVGEGRYRNDPEKRDRSIAYVMGLGSVSAMVVGFEKPEEIDDFARRVEKAEVSAKS
jgi:aryl-alcohol dehydrogenase-like predicted oxidoreductase